MSIGPVSLEVKGEASYQGALAAIAGPKTEEGYSLPVTAVLHREPENRYDPNAIAVHVNDARDKPRLVGYVNRTDAERLAPAIDRMNRDGKIVGMRGTIVGGWRRGDDVGHYGIWLSYNPADFER